MFRTSKDCTEQPDTGIMSSTSASCSSSDRSLARAFDRLNVSQCEADSETAEDASEYIGCCCDDTMKAQNTPCDAENGLADGVSLCDNNSRVSVSEFDQMLHCNQFLLHVGILANVCDCFTVILCASCVLTFKRVWFTIPDFMCCVLLYSSISQ